MKPFTVGALRPATTYATTVQDTVDLHAGDATRGALARLAVPTTMLTAPRGLQDEVPGLYAGSRLAGLLRAHPTIAHREVPDVNHYTLVMSPHGAQAVAAAVVAGVAATPTEGTPA